MDFSLEEAFEVVLELVMMSGVLGIATYYFINMHKLQ